ncbi:enoyl-CoA hydratase/isomerase family protein [Nocardia asiatica]|uniref:enoyl-CoA hydratase/isomerase family protein n=1 Tax=Nocardia asiatica TaxID=209252 RepID=UPI003EE3C638
MDSDASIGDPEELDLSIRPDGAPDNPLLVIPFDAWESAPAWRVERLAAGLAELMRLTVGVVRGPVTARLATLAEAATLTLVESDSGNRHAVRCADIDAAVRRLREAVGRSPRASVALGRLLRQTAVLDTVSGLAAEAAVYSMLLNGSEFRRWLADRGAPRTVPPADRPLVRVDRVGDALSVVLDHAERRNALSYGLREELLAAVRVAELDSSVERVLLSGAGPVFCSGGDLDEFGTASDLVAAYLVRLERAPWRILDRLRDRVTVTVHGACIGAGIEMAAFAGRVVAAENTVFRLPEVEMGLVPGAGGTVGITRRVGRWRAAWMMLTGDVIDSETALRWRLVDEVRSGVGSGRAG